MGIEVVEYSVVEWGNQVLEVVDEEIYNFIEYEKVC